MTFDTLLYEMTAMRDDPTYRPPHDFIKVFMAFMCDVLFQDFDNDHKSVRHLSKTDCTKIETMFSLMHQYDSTGISYGSLFKLETLYVAVLNHTKN